ncbi:MAG: epoxide hydrolase [Acidimicrobiia bacterium]|nr:epoxide hydrolase [Acidimicrobiia bacterium]
MSDAVRPFEIHVTDDVLADLRRRLHATRWPEPEVVDDWTQGIPLSYVQELAAYWADEYDWRSREAALDRWPGFITEIDGVDIHFLDVRSPHDGAMPIVITHGWPGSIVEFQEIIGPLTDPTAHGGDAADAFHVVCPTLPGYGFSGKPTSVGFGVERIARAWDELMGRLGFESYVAQGGDWGSAVTSYIGMIGSSRCAAIHTNMPVAGPDPDAMDDLTEQEVAALDALGYYSTWDSGYSKQQSTRPQTLGYALTDSPAGQLAWIMEKFWSWTDRSGHPEDSFDRDRLLDNAMFYWATASATSSARLYWESFADFGDDTIDIPTMCSLFPNEIIASSRRWAERRYTDIRYWNELDHGGHFPAFEVPDLFVAELRAAFRQLR